MHPGFKDRLRSTRENKGLSQSELAKRAGLQPAAISHFETGQRMPSFENLRKLADALSVGVDFLLGRTDEQGMETSVRAQALFRHAEKMSEESFAFLESMAKTLSEKDEQRRKSPGK